MKAKEFLDEYVKKDKREKVSCLGLAENGTWFHIHESEEIGQDFKPVISVRKGEKNGKEK